MDMMRITPDRSGAIYKTNEVTLNTQWMGRWTLYWMGRAMDFTLDVRRSPSTTRQTKQPRSETPLAKQSIPAVVTK